jgi:hypothetical protein
MIVFCTASIAEETSQPKRRNGQAAACASREATVLSMMGWGVGIFAGIAVLCSLLNNNPEEGSGVRSP